MTSDDPDRRRSVVLLDEARADLRRVAERSPVAARAVVRMLKALELGVVDPIPLRDFGKTGDLSDCGKVVVDVEDDSAHRIVVRRADGAGAVLEVIAVEDRADDLPYLLAGLRLGRLDDPVRRTDAGRRIWRIRQALDGGSSE